MLTSSQCYDTALALHEIFVHLLAGMGVKVIFWDIAGTPGRHHLGTSGAPCASRGESFAHELSSPEWENQWTLK